MLEGWEDEKLLYVMMLRCENACKCASELCMSDHMRDTMYVRT